MPRPRAVVRERKKCPLLKEMLWKERATKRTWTPPPTPVVHPVVLLRTIPTARTMFWRPPARKRRHRQKRKRRRRRGWGPGREIHLSKRVVAKKRKKQKRWHPRWKSRRRKMRKSWWPRAIERWGKKKLQCWKQNWHKQRDKRRDKRTEGRKRNPWKQGNKKTKPDVNWGWGEERRD